MGEDIGEERGEEVSLLSALVHSIGGTIQNFDVIVIDERERNG